MAEIFLGSISIEQTFKGFVAGEFFIINFDDTTEGIRVYKDGVEIFGEDDLISNGTSDPYGWFVRKSTGAIVPAGDGTSFTFPELSTFPYYTIFKLPAPPDDAVDDIALSLVGVTKVTSQLATNGVIEVLATGTNTPFLYSLQDPEVISDGSMQSSGTFSNLNAGRYKVYAKDSEGFIDALDVWIGVESSEEQVSYGVRWRMAYTDRLGYKKRIDILERDYSDGITQVSGDGNSYASSFRSEGSDIMDLDIMSRTATADFIATSFGQYLDIARGDEKQFLLKERVFNGSTYDVVWTGAVDPSQYSDELYQGSTRVSVVATDRLATLKNQEYRPDDTNIDFFNIYRGRASQFKMIKRCLDKLGLNNGYRLAVNLFESSHTATNNSPIRQTYVQQEVYNDIEGSGTASTCDQVVKDILRIYGAVLFSWEGYWYVVRLEEFKLSSIDYTEWTKQGSFVGSGSWSPQVSFDRPSTANSWRWSGRQVRTFTEPYKEVILETKPFFNEQGIIRDISLKNLISFTNEGSPENALDALTGTIPRFRNWRLKAGDPFVYSALKIREGDAGQGLKSVWQVGLRRVSYNSDTFVASSGSITYSRGDRFVFNTNVRVSSLEFPDGEINKIHIRSCPPFFLLKWTLKVGTKHFNSSNGEWSDSVVLNYKWIPREDYEKVITHEVEGFFNVEVGDPVAKTETYLLKVYAISLIENHISLASATDQDIIDEMKGITTVGVSEGTRILVGDLRSYVTGENWRGYYYELRLDDRVDNGVLDIRPNDYDSVNNAVTWVVNTNGKPSNQPYSGVLVSTPETDYYEGQILLTEFDWVNLKYLPQGNALTETLLTAKYKSKVNLNNATLYLSDQNQFDVPTSRYIGLSNNTDNIILNTLRLSDGTETSSWSFSGGVTRSIQEHYLSFILSAVKRPRSRVNGTFVPTQRITPLNVLVDSNDDDRVYLLTSVNINDRSSEYNGEMIELSNSSTESSTISAFTTGFKQNSVT